VAATVPSAKGASFSSVFSIKSTGSGMSEGVLDVLGDGRRDLLHLPDDGAPTLRLARVAMVDGWSTRPRFQQNRVVSVSRRFLADSRHFAALARCLSRALRPLFRIMSPLL
jgi:hypothetical protein